MDKRHELIELGLKIRAIRISKGFTQMELAYRIGKDHPSINRLEKGKINPNYIFLLEICEGLEVKIEEIFK